MISLQVHPEARRRNIERCKEHGIVLPTFAQMKDPDLAPSRVVERLARVGLWDVHPLNLFRITWRNEAKEHGGSFGGVNSIEFPRELTGVDAKVIALIGKWFPTGAHKVGAAYGCLAPALATGAFDATRQKAAWPSTGNYCRGGAFTSALLGCESIAILPEGMSRERFEWLRGIGAEIIKTPGSESNVKEIFDRCRELARARGDEIAIFNQFEEFGNYLWHFEVTGSALERVLEERKAAGEVRAFVSATGSAGTIASGDSLKARHPGVKLAAAEALQCPTLSCNGYGSHRIEGIGDKHVPWIHNVRNTDVVVAVDDRDCMRLLRLFNEPAGQAYLVEQGMPPSFVARLPLAGISGMANLIASIKLARYFELGERDIIVTVLTDSIDLYRSRVEELRAEEGPFGREEAIRAHAIALRGQEPSHVLELRWPERRRVHNLKYYTWVEQQGRSVDELEAQWSDPEYWRRAQALAPRIDELIGSFNREVGIVS